MFRLVLGVIFGAALAYFLDPDNGAKRRNEARDRFGSTTGTSVEQLTEIASAKAQGVAAQATASARKATQPKKSYDDATLTEKVKTELYGKDPDAKGSVLVNVQNGVVQLRGELQTPSQIEQAEKTAKAIEGVSSVENLIHLPGTPAPKS